MATSDRRSRTAVGRRSGSRTSPRKRRAWGRGGRWANVRAAKAADKIGIAHGFRSGLEDRNAKWLTEHGIAFDFEKRKIKYTVPASEHSYTPDFEIKANGIIVETKGQFTPEDRQKHLYVKAQHPKLDIRFVFTNPNAPIYKGSKTTYAKWCEKHGFKYATKLIPLEWCSEKRKT